MVDVRELEKRWIRYKLKSYLPIAILSVSLILIVVVGWNIVDTKIETKTKTPRAKTQKEIPTNTAKNEHTSIVEKNVTVIKTTPLQPLEDVKKRSVRSKEQPIAIEQTQAVSQKTLPPTQKSQEDRTVLRPSLDFLRKMKDNSVVPLAVQPQTRTNLAPEQKPQLQAPQKQTKPLDEVEPTQTTTQSKQKPKLTIEVKKTSQKEIEEIIRRFKKTNNPVLSLFVARKYYELGKYHNAYNYALITNQIDSSIEDSWIIFAKSLVKLGKKEKAIQTLQTYIQTSNSKKAKILLDNIKTGKFQ